MVVTQYKTLHPVAFACFYVPWEENFISYLQATVLVLLANFPSLTLSTTDLTSCLVWNKPPELRECLYEKNIRVALF